MANQHAIGTHKTSIRTEDCITYVRYHNTDVVKFSRHDVWLDSGGWMTVTTKTRMNQAARQFGLPYTVYQRNFKWYVDVMGEVVPFKDGMTIGRG
jgi:hypothetical protein